MSERKFEGILEYLCGNIAFKSERRDAMDELYDHLMIKYETNLACGMSEDEAEDDAVNQLGNLDIIKENLMRTHRKSPIKFLMNSFFFLSIMCFYALLIVMTTHTYYSDLFWLVMLSFAIGSIAWGAVYIRKISKRFHIVFVSTAVFCLSLVLCYSSMLDSESAIIVLKLTAVILFLMNCYSIFFAINNLFDLNGIVFNNVIKLKAACWLIITTVCSIIMCFYFFRPEWNSKDTQFFILCFLSLPIIVSNNLFLNSVYNTLTKNSIKLNTEKSILKKGFAVIVAVVVLWSTYYSFEYISFYLPNDKTINGLTINYDSKDRAMIENVMSKYGISKELLELLPDSEIENYKCLEAPMNNSMMDDYLSTEINEHIMLFNQEDVPDDIEYPVILKCKEYLFPLRCEKDGMIFRLLRITDYTMSDEDYEFFSKYIAGSFDYNSWNRKDDLESDEYRIDIASETVLLADIENGTITYRKPIRETKGPDSETIGCEFRIKRKTHLIYAVNITIKDSNNTRIWYTTDYVFKKKPILYKYRLVQDISNKLEYEMIGNNSVYGYRVYFKHKEKI